MFNSLLMVRCYWFHQTWMVVEITLPYNSLSIKKTNYEIIYLRSFLMRNRNEVLIIQDLYISPDSERINVYFIIWFYVLSLLKIFFCRGKCLLRLIELETTILDWFDAKISFIKEKKIEREVFQSMVNSLYPLLCL